MLLSSFPRWMNTRSFSFPRDSQKNTKYEKRRTPLRLEVLEDRGLPSTVMNLNDSGFGSLRQAIIDTPSGGTVNFEPGLTGPITLITGELLIDKDLTIAGPGADVITVSGNNASRVFDIAATFTVAISALTIANGTSFSNGGGILDNGTLSIDNSVISGNRASFNGGGIYNDGTLAISNSAILGNFANEGGGVYNNFGTVSIVNSTISGNTNGSRGGGIANQGSTLSINNSIITNNRAGLSGGGIVNFDRGIMVVANSTINSNTAAGSSGTGGGIANGNSLTIINSTISGNSANQGGGIDDQGRMTTVITNCTISGNIAGGFSGGGINFLGSEILITNSTISNNTSLRDGGGFAGARAKIRNTILAGNTAPIGPDVRGPLNSQGHNLIGDGAGGSGFADTDLVGTGDFPIDPKLGPLQDNGGPTQTMGPAPGQPRH